MTTAWSLFVPGQTVPSLQANAGGTLLALLSAVVAPWSILSPYRGRWIGPAPSNLVAAWLAITVATVTVIDWIVRLVTR